MTVPSQWTYEEIEKVLEDKRDNKAISAEVSRTPNAIEQVKEKATAFRLGKMQYVSKSLQAHLKRYYTNKGNMTFEQTETAEDTCEARIESIAETAEELFEQMKSLMTQIATTATTHQNHSVLKEVEELRAWKTEALKELSGLRELRETAQRSNFASMIRRTVGRPSES